MTKTCNSMFYIIHLKSEKSETQVEFLFFSTTILIIHIRNAWKLTFLTLARLIFHL